MKKDYTLLTSESVTEGHPDKVCDIISDAILDAYLSQDPASHVAVETMASEGIVFIAGEVTSSGSVDVGEVARKVLVEIGYDDKKKGMDGRDCVILTNIVSQSPDIAQGVVQENGEIGAGDQGMMFGYASDETKEYMPLSISLAHKLTKQLTRVRKEGILPYLYPDGKSQVTVACDDNGDVVGISDVVISSQHNADIAIEQLRADIEEYVIRAVIPNDLLLPDVKIYINPTGRFVVGGPEGDVGLTGRKIIVDTYGGIARHGGGAFSGKDPTKVDRSAAYMARYAAKNVVAAGLCRKCEVNLAYAIGVAQPVSIKIDTFGTEELPKKIIEKAVRAVFDFSVAGIISNLSLTKVTYKPVAAYGHFGRDELNLPWEKTDKVTELQMKTAALLAEEICKINL